MASEVIMQGDLGKVPGEALKTLKRLMTKDTPLLQSHVKKTYFGGATTANMLHNRTGQLRNSVRPMLPVQIENMAVKGGLMFGKIYAFSHVGPKGGFKTIRPKNRKWLTIPMKGLKEAEAALFTKAGQSRGGAMSGQFADTFIKKSKAGNLIIFGKGTYQKGAKAGEAKGKLTPLFILKKQVRIPYRIHPIDLFKWFAEKFANSIREEGLMPHGGISG